ncbi:MAG: bifunctional (p)ppGpp synthetase/guanosine-3',5'-bis(diphosphate) 3'-pyrophosphohydrolase [Bacteroidales bacterium]|nr:bifunctional (p)ppGpp synthetase/guanosine-3',5'-bis(diphosphate) 3'-pyrophosphohydrolase [Bacteroidales bacterium]
MKNGVSRVESELEKLLKLVNERDDSKNADQVQLAWQMAHDNYGDQLQPDGSPFILHHLEVAIIALREMNLGVPSVVCALLHSMDISKPEVAAQITDTFGKNILEIIEGFKKISELQTERVSFQSDTFRVLFLSMVDDIRVILLRMAHRLNDVRRPRSLTKKQQKKFFDEIKYIYIPIAHRLGLYYIKSEMEEDLMRYEFPEIYKAIEEKIQATRTKREVYIKDFVRPIEQELMSNKFDYQIKWRTKSIPSIWAKMKKQNVEFEEVYDLFAIRVIINSKSQNREKEDCWRVYSLVTNIYNPNPKRLRDWVTTPKASGYESLHTTVMGQNNKWVEVQIRTSRMDEVAEKGQAAHWQYKGLMKSKEVDDWLLQVRDVLEHPEVIGDEYAYRTKKSQEFVFVFTPKGDLRRLSAGATILDFAYDIHTNVGNTCSGARVNNKLVPIRYVLKSGDRVDIVTTKNQKPKHDWLGIVVSTKAKNHIRRQLKEEKYKEAEIGKTLLLRKIRNWKLKSSDDLINVLVKHFKLDSAIDLYYLVAADKLEMSLVKSVLQDYLKERPAESQEEVVKEVKSSAAKDRQEEDILYIGDYVKNVNYRFAKCCNPIHGDDVFGFVTHLGSISIHRNSCPNASRLRFQYPYRILDVKWMNQEDKNYSLVNLKITGKDQLGMVESVTRIITGDLRVNMRSISFNTKGNQFEGKVSLMIRDTSHLSQLTYKLTQIKGVDKVIRIK